MQSAETKIDYIWTQIFSLQRRLIKIERRYPSRVLTDIKHMSEAETLKLWEDLTIWFEKQRTEEPKTTSCGMGERLIRFLQERTEPTPSKPDEANKDTK